VSKLIAWVSAVVASTAAVVVTSTGAISGAGASSPRAATCAAIRSAGSDSPTDPSSAVLAEHRRQFVAAARASLQLGAADDRTHIAISFLETRRADEGAALVRARGIDPKALVVGFPGALSYFYGSLGLQDGDRELDVSEVLSRYLVDLDSRVKGTEQLLENMGHTPAASAALEDLLAQQQDAERNGLPVIGIEGDGTVADARGFATAHPDAVVAVDACDRAAKVIPPPVADQLWANANAGGADPAAPQGPAGSGETAVDPSGMPLVAPSAAPGQPAP